MFTKSALAQEAEEAVLAADRQLRSSRPPAVIWEAFTLVFIAELGDRTQLATVFLATSPAFTFAGLLAELHLLGCFWGDCSLSNVLYRFDAETVMAICDTDSVDPAELIFNDIEFVTPESAAGSVQAAAVPTALRSGTSAQSRNTTVMTPPPMPARAEIVPISDPTTKVATGPGSCLPPGGR